MNKCDFRFDITWSNVTILHIEDLKSKAIILEQDKYSLVILEPINDIAFLHLENNLGVSEFLINSTSTLEFPILFQGYKSRWAECEIRFLKYPRCASKNEAHVLSAYEIDIDL